MSVQRQVEEGSKRNQESFATATYYLGLLRYT